jgi:5-methylcytosine-specific restriction endonuclease McrA
MGLHVALDAHHLARMDRARSAALARDGYSCQVCGTATRPVSAHVWRQPWLMPSYRAQNLISLCGRCHEAAHARSKGPASWI